MSHKNLIHHYPKYTNTNPMIIQDEINRIVNNHLYNMGLSNPENENTMSFLEPNIEVRDNPKEITVSAELPGLDPNDIDIQVSDDGYLTISGEKKHQAEEKSEGFYFSERSYGMFQRVVNLPTDEINREKITAEFDKGVLNITLPKLESAKKKLKKIAIKSK
jgi:HSP20 family protein